jgi:hypothetical protein
MFMAKDKAARERARKAKRKQARIHSEHRARQGKRLHDLLSAALDGSPQAIAALLSQDNGRAISAPAYFEAMLLLLGEVGERVRAMSKAMSFAVAARAQDADPCDLQAACYSFVVRDEGSGPGRPEESPQQARQWAEWLPTPRALLVHAADPTAIARAELGQRPDAVLSGLVFSLLSYGLDKDVCVWAVLCTDREGRLAGWTIDEDDWYPVSQPLRLLESACESGDGPPGEIQLLGKLLSERGYSPPDAGLEVSHPAVIEALDVFRAATHWESRRALAACQHAELCEKAADQTRGELERFLEITRAGVREFQKEAQQLRQLAQQRIQPAPPAAPAPAAASALPSLAHRMAALFAPL